jgi:hypothetical protein
MGHHQQELDLAVVLGGDQAAEARVGDVPVGEGDGTCPLSRNRSPLRPAVTSTVTSRVVPCRVSLPCALAPTVPPSPGSDGSPIGLASSKVAVG